MEAPPPAEREPQARDRLWLVAELVWLTLTAVPAILYSLLRKIFPPAGKSLAGQLVVVTGGGRGLGRGLALRFAAEGCPVAVVDLNRTSAEKTAEEIVASGGWAKAYGTNVAKPDEVRALRTGVTADFGREAVDVLVNNAGIVYGEPFDRMTDQEIRAVMEVNLLSHFWTTREFLPGMRTRNSGHVVAVASITSFAGGANGTAYVASKFGVSGFMESLRYELEEFVDNRIKTTTVHPYFINTSEYYVKQWHLRLPVLSIADVVEATVAGVKRDTVTVTVPGYLYFLLHLRRLLPQNIMDRGLKIFYARLLVQSSQEKETSPTSALIKSLKLK